jgi:hypothetical protein
MVLINCKLQFTLGAPGRNSTFFLVPLILAVNLKAGGINDDNTARFQRFGQLMSGQVNAALGQTTEITDADVDAQSGDHSIQKALGLAQWQVKNLTDHQASPDRNR